MHQGGLFHKIVLIRKRQYTQRSKAQVTMSNPILVSIAWCLGASLVGFGISGIFSWGLKLSRRLFLIPYIFLSSIFLYLFYQSYQLDMIDLLTKNWVWGVAAGVIVGAFLVLNVRSQPATRQSTGGELVFDVLWLGFAYGITDALLLNVMPVLAIQAGFSNAEWTSSAAGTIGLGLLALAASLVVTLAYHLGYKEFQNKSVFLVLVGNALITLAFILSSNPLGALISHTVMHIAAAIRGPETTVQLPPHTNQQHYQHAQ